jgi:hypothetical protein
LEGSDTRRSARLAPSVIFALQLMGVVVLAAAFAVGSLYLMYWFGSRASAVPFR